MSLDLPFGHGKRYMSNFTGGYGQGGQRMGSGWRGPYSRRASPWSSATATRTTPRSFGGGSRPNFVPGCSKGAPAGGTSNKINEWFNTGFASYHPRTSLSAMSHATDANLRGSGVNNFDFGPVQANPVLVPIIGWDWSFRTEFFNNLFQPHAICAAQHQRWIRELWRW